MTSILVFTVIPFIFILLKLNISLLLTWFSLDCRFYRGEFTGAPIPAFFIFLVSTAALFSSILPFNLLVFVCFIKNIGNN